MLKSYCSLTLLVLATGLSALSAQAQNQTLLALRDLEPRELRMEAFRLDTRQNLRVEAVGAESREDNFIWENGMRHREDRWPGEAWILDARTREVVWTLRKAGTESRRGIHTFEGTVTLPAGDYEAYYASYAGTSSYWGSWENLGSQLSEAVSRAFSRDKPRRDDRDEVRYGGEFVDNGAYRDFRLLIKGDGRLLSHAEVEGLRDTFEETAIVSLPAFRDESYQQAGFILERPLDLDLYALGEARRDESFDYGWIINADTRKKVWVLDYHTSDHAGGSGKNRVVRETLSLPAGRYAAFFVTDGSHSPEEWNTVPAYDPDFWGLTLRMQNPADKDAVDFFTYEHVPDRDAIVSLVGLGDDDMVSRGFTLKRPMDVRIYALGEGTGRRMVDYGWILDAKTHRRVWEMDYRATEHAGGARKNRLVDTVVSLDAGDYIVYYATDGSHAYHDWNAARPIDAEHWGITILPARSNFDRSQVATFDETEAPNVLAQILHVRDDKRERARFSLDRPARVRIYALGEGDDGAMYDYGWIEDAETGRAVWEMTYRLTDHAGGARKNRRYDDTIRLPAGDYVLYYRTDGSHAFNDWNASPPSDPLHWGIAVYRTEAP